MMDYDVYLAKIISFIEGIKYEYQELKKLEIFDPRLEAIQVSARAILKEHGHNDEEIALLNYICPQCNSNNTTHDIMHLNYPYNKEGKEWIQIPYETEAVTCNSCGNFWSDFSGRDEMIALMKYIVAEAEKEEKEKNE